MPQIANNAGDEGSVLVGKILKMLRSRSATMPRRVNMGDMIQMGIINPMKVVPSVLQDVASDAGLLITTEAMIADALKEAASNARRRHGWYGRHGLLKLD